MPFTINQQKAIDLANCNISVAASAGSGKTTVLVERILKRVMVDKIPLDRILAMTFTEAAASEMKVRLFERLSLAINEGVYDKPFVQAQLVLLQKAQISTIHAFCLNIIKENYAFIGLDINRIKNVISSEEEMIFINKAIDNTFKQYENDPLFSKFKQYFTSNAQDIEDLRSETLSMANLLYEVDYATFKTLNNQIYSARCINELPLKIKEAFFMMLADYLSYIEEDLAELIKMSDNSALSMKMAFMQTLKELINSQDYPGFVLQYISFTSIAFKNITSDLAFSNKRKALREVERTLLDMLFDEDVLIKDLNSNKPYVELLIEMANTFNQNLDKYKKEFGFIDFNDMERYAIQILSTHQDVAKNYQNKFIDIMVDEYQDSSLTQDKMLSYISKGNNIFRVGDVKQSIYRFRSALPDLLKGYIENPQPDDAVIFLQENFRSNSQIINFVNAIFVEMMNLSTLKSNFNKQDFALVGSPQTQNEKHKCIEYHAIISDAIDSDKEEKSNTIRANYIAQLIMYEQTKNNYKWSDFVVLVRSNARKADFKKAFEVYNIPNFIDAKEGFYKSNVVSCISSYLNLLINPYNDLYFSAVCLSPFYAFNDDTLASITLDLRQSEHKSLFAYFKNSSSDKYTHIIQDIEAINHLNGIKDKLIALYQINHFYDLKTTASERTNLDLLLDKGFMYEQKNNDGLIGFVAFINSLKDFKSSEALSINIDEDVVRVMTIHQSKGLQFKYVLYWGKERTSNVTYDKLIKDAGLGVGMDYLDINTRIARPSFIQNTLKHLNQKAEIEEEIRIIYVALTRAKAKLILLSTFKEEKLTELKSLKMSAYQLIKSCHFSNWLFLACLKLEDHVNIVEVTSPIDVTANFSVSNNTYQLIPIASIPHVPLTKVASKHKLSLNFLNTTNDANLVGTLTHHILEKLDLSKNYNLLELQAIASEIDYALYLKVDYQSIHNFINNPFTQALSQKTLKTEYNFVFKDETSTIISGIIDLLVEDDECIYIIDYKTDHQKAIEDFKKDYTPQLKTYQKAINLNYKKQIKCYIYALSINEYILLDI